MLTIKQCIQCEPDPPYSTGCLITSMYTPPACSAWLPQTPEPCLFELQTSWVQEQAHYMEPPVHVGDEKNTSSAAKCVLLRDKCDAEDSSWRVLYGQGVAHC